MKKDHRKSDKKQVKSKTYQNQNSYDNESNSLEEGLSQFSNNDQLSLGINL
jgi:hypothetical protein